MWLLLRNDPTSPPPPVPPPPRRWRPQPSHRCRAISRDLYEAAGIGTVISGIGVVNALQMASAVLAALPLVFVFPLAQRQIVEGVDGTGLK